VRRQDLAARRAALPELDDRVTLLHGDFREIGQTLAEASADVILTDPPYTQASLPLWSALAAFASRVLKPGGFLIALSGHMFLSEVMRALDASLRYFWVGALYHPGAELRVWARHCVRTTTPVLIYAKSDALPPDWWQDGAATVASKLWHEWGQDPDALVKIVRGFVQPGSVVVDPFLGGGTSALVALALGARVIGIEINPRTLAVAEARIRAWRPSATRSTGPTGNLQGEG
jgi:DNA methylase